MVSEEFMDEIIESEIEQMDENCEKRISGAQEIISSQCDEIEQLKAELHTSELNRQSLWVDSLKLVDENAALKSKLKIAADALSSISNVVGTSTLQYQMAQKALSEIEG